MEFENAINEFRAAMESHGIVTTDEIHGDGKLHRFHVEGDSRGKENGWYVLHLDNRPSGSFGSWKTGQSETWTAHLEKKLTASERRELEIKIASQRLIRDEEERQVHADAAIRAQEIWDHSTPASYDHPYLVRKSIKPNKIRESRGNLVIPISDSSGKIWSLQFISPQKDPVTERDKNYLSGGKKNGCYFTIKKTNPSPEGPICICEGFSTGASIHAATDYAVVVAFDSGNLEPVSRAIREKFPKAKIILCADNDQWTKGNPGIESARFSAERISGLLAVPEFEHASETNKLTDFNDLAGSEGLQRVFELIQAAIPVLPDIQVVPQDAQIDGHSEVAALDPANIPSGLKYNIFDWPVMGGRGKPISCIENVDHMIRLNQITVRYDVIRKDMQVIIPGQTYLVDTERNDKMTRIVSIASMAGIPGGRIEDFVAHIAGQNLYNPVAEWITSKPWDEKSRIADFYSTVEAVGDEDQLRRVFKETILKRWMVSAIAAAFRPAGVSAHGILVFKGDQYIGKTNWFKSLVPQSLKLTRDGMLLDPKDKDSVYQIVSNWIVELGEIDATFRKADIAQLKAFITKDEDILRLPYQRSPSSFARRTVFFASVNDETFLSDPTGNRRFWTIDCKSLNHQHSLDMQQVWSEFYAMYQNGEAWYLNQDEMAFLNAHNREFETITPMDELIAMRLDWDEPRSLWKARTATEIAVAVGIREPNERHLKQVARAIREITGQKRTRDAKARYIYVVPSAKFLD